MAAQHSCHLSGNEPIRSFQTIFTQPILIVDSDDLFLASSRQLLSKGGFVNVRVTGNQKNALSILKKGHNRLIIIGIGLDSREKGGFDFLRQVRSQGYRDLVVILSYDTSPEALFEANSQGADDYLIKGPDLELYSEVYRQLKRPQRDHNKTFCPQRLEKIGFFRSQGLTKLEMCTLKEFANGFPRHSELAIRVGKTEDNIRKTFSRIYSKLGWPKASNNAARLSQLITICAMYQLMARG